LAFVQQSVVDKNGGDSNWRLEPEAWTKCGGRNKANAWNNGFFGLQSHGGSWQAGVMANDAKSKIRRKAGSLFPLAGKKGI
jgi:hypothetical protein